MKKRPAFLLVEMVVALLLFLTFALTFSSLVMQLGSLWKNLGERLRLLSTLEHFQNGPCNKTHYHEKKEGTYTITCQTKKLQRGEIMGESLARFLKNKKALRTLPFEQTQVHVLAPEGTSPTQQVFLYGSVTL